MSDRDELGGLTCDEVRELAGAFVLGALEPADDAAVRAHLAACDDPHEEIAELGAVLPALAVSVPVVEPPAGLKDRIMAAAAADLAARTTPATVAPSATVAPQAPAAPAPTEARQASADEPVPFPTAEERTARRSRASAGTWILRIAAVLAIVALGGWNLVLQSDLNAATSYEQSVAAVLDVAAQPGSLTAVLTPGDGTGRGLAAVSSTGEVTMALQDLASTSGEKVYTAWAIGADATPVPIGDFTVGPSGVASFTATGVPPTPGIVLALTLEPSPGAKAPSGPVVSKGVTT